MTTENALAAAVFIYSPIRNQVVLTTRRESSMVGLPGGKVDEGETVCEAAAREVLEETGISVHLQESPVFTGIIPGPVPYEVSGWYVEYDGPLPGGTESGIHAYWGSVSELILNSPFRDWNAAFLGLINPMTVLSLRERHSTSTSSSLPDNSHRYGCFNRAPFRSDFLVNVSPSASQPTTEWIPFRLSPDCNYTLTEIGKSDRYCAGCKWSGPRSSS